MTLWLLRPKGWPTDETITDAFEAGAVAEEIGAEPWTSWYDKAYGFIVRAPDEATARRLAQANAGAERAAGDDEALGVWLDPAHTSCVPLRADGNAAVLMREFWRS